MANIANMNWIRFQSHWIISPRPITADEAPSILRAELQQLSKRILSKMLQPNLQSLPPGADPGAGLPLSIEFCGLHACVTGLASNWIILPGFCLSKHWTAPPQCFLQSTSTLWPNLTMDLVFTSTSVDNVSLAVLTNIVCSVSSFQLQVYLHGSVGS